MKLLILYLTFLSLYFSCSSKEFAKEYVKVASLEFEELEYFVRSELNSCVFKNKLLDGTSRQIKVSFYEEGFILKKFIVSSNIKNENIDIKDMSLCVERLSNKSEEIYKIIKEGKFLGFSFLEQKKGCSPWLEGEGFPIEKLKFVFPDRKACSSMTKEKLKLLENSF